MTSLTDGQNGSHNEWAEPPTPPDLTANKRFMEKITEHMNHRFTLGPAILNDDGVNGWYTTTLYHQMAYLI